jgi:4-amino-4-deoxy-L-arabinose transferase-like glycosyltransferase
LGRHWHAAYLVNIGSMILLFAAVYDLARRWWNNRPGVFAVLIVGTMPLLYGLATWFMVEYTLTAVAAAAVWLLVESDGMARRGVVVLFGVVCGLGLLLKASFSMFILFPFLYFWIKSRDRLRSLLYASIPCLIVALLWYAIHLRETFLRWLKEPEFDTPYREARRAAFRQSVARLQQASGAAVTTLLKLMIDPAAPPSTKARAADSVLDHSAKAIELEDIEARVSELERAAEASKQHR